MFSFSFFFSLASDDGLMCLLLRGGMSCSKRNEMGVGSEVGIMIFSEGRVSLVLKLD